MTAHKLEARTEGHVLILERVFDAPHDLVFAMFKEPEHLKRWWGPRGWELPVCDLDFRPGGVWHYCMKCVEQGEYFGMESWGKGVYKEIVEPEKIVYTDYFSDADGNTNEEMSSTAGRHRSNVRTCGGVPGRGQVSAMLMAAGSRTGGLAVASINVRDRRSTTTANPNTASAAALPSA